jgi:biotin synthase
MIMSRWHQLAEQVLAGQPAGQADALAVLESPDDDLLTLLDAAFRVRRAHFGRGVRLHVIRNARSGACGEDCSYCSQSSRSTEPVSTHPMQTPDDILGGAREAQAMGAVRYCVVTSGRKPAPTDLAAACEAARRIKREASVQICNSLGLLTLDQARALKEAGVDRYNHNLETSERFFPSICRTHTYADRLATIRAVKAAGLELCSGGIIGLGETLEDRADLALTLRKVGADSIPLNFLDPRPGTALADRPRPTAREALRALAMFRFVNPAVELRMAGGREACLGPLQALGLFAANSMFTNGYLTTGGQGHAADIAMIEAAGFHVAELTRA